jgi:hypothetical protein
MTVAPFFAAICETATMTLTIIGGDPRERVGAALRQVPGKLPSFRCFLDLLGRVALVYGMASERRRSSCWPAELRPRAFDSWLVMSAVVWPFSATSECWPRAATSFAGTSRAAYRVASQQAHHAVGRLAARQVLDPWAMSAWVLALRVEFRKQRLLVSRPPRPTGRRRADAISSPCLSALASGSGAMELLSSKSDAGGVHHWVLGAAYIQSLPRSERSSLV